MEEDSKTHRSPVTAMVWSAAGDRLMTADENGKLSIWKTDRLLRPIHVVSFEEQPGCRIRIITLGGTEPMAEGGMPANIVYYGVNVEGRSVLKWANDQG
ncbi:WD_REPEATS_REGION domain-containing protein, partial [Haematococcus lacustris]